MGTSPPHAGLYRAGVPFRVLVEEAERAIVEEALRAHGGQMTATARALELERSHLYKKARALGLRGDRAETEDEERGRSARFSRLAAPRDPTPPSWARRPRRDRREPRASRGGA